MGAKNSTNYGINAIKRFSIRVGKTLIHFSDRGVRIKSRYRLMLVNDSRMSTLWSYSGGRVKMIITVLVLCFTVTIAGVALLGMTPLRTLLPGYLKRSQRYEMVEMSTRLDSLARLTAVNNLYLGNMVAVLNDEIVFDSVQYSLNDSVGLLKLPVDSLIETSEAEKEFVRRYEQRERFNVSVLTPIAAEGMVFYPPVRSSLARSTNSSGRITYQLSPASPVSAVYRGTVIDSYYTPLRGYTIVIQHPNNFISRYGGLVEPMVERGGKVNAGARIGLSSSERVEDRLPVTFEMWYNGSQIDPSGYIDN